MFAQPVLIAPPNSTSIYTHEHLIWSKVSSAEMYEYRISGNTNFTPADEDLEVTDTTTKILSVLIPNRIYFWQVRAKVNGTWGNYSSIRTFSVMPSNISPPVLISPENGTNGVLTNPILKWSSVPEREQYAVVVAADMNFTNVIYGRCIDTTFYEMPSDTLQLNTQYYWAVCSQDSLGFGYFSPVWSFRVRATSVQNISTSIPNKYVLYNNYPNPFNPSTKIKFDLPQNSFVKINIFDASGRNVKTLVSENLSAGKYETEFNASDFPSGIYYYTFAAENFTAAKKMILIK